MNPDGVCVLAESDSIRAPAIQRLRVPLLENRPLPGDQLLLRLQAPEIAAQAQPGSFVHLNCDPTLTLPRPFSILDCDADGAISLLIKVVGRGTKMLRAWRPGDQVELAGPIGRPFQLPSTSGDLLLIAGGVGLAPLDFLARRAVAEGLRPILLFGCETESPFALHPASDGDGDGDGDGAESTLAQTLAQVAPAGALALQRLSAVGVESRLSSLTPRPGWFTGYVTDLAARLLESLPPARRQQTRIFTCGPLPMMAAAARLAERFGVAGEASLEARMACGFGGCAGCVAPIRQTGADWGYRRVCVDGPVFPISQVAWEQWT